MHDVDIDMQGYWRKFIRELKGNPIDFINEASVNSTEYTSEVKPVIKIGIIPLDETSFGLPCGNSILYVADNSDGIELKYWFDYCNKLNKHVNPKGRLGMFGEGVRKAGLSASIEEPRTLITRTKAINEEEKYATFKLTAIDGQEAFQCGEKITDLPNWVKPFLTMPIGEHGTYQFIKTKTVDAESIKLVMQNVYSLALRNKTIDLRIVLHEPNSINHNEYAVFAPTYNASKTESFTITISGCQIPCIAFVGANVLTNAHTQGRQKSITHVGDTSFFVNGWKVKTMRNRRDDVIVEADVTNVPEFLKGITANKDDVSEAVDDKYCIPTDDNVKTRYKDRQEKSIDEKATEITKAIMNKLLQNPRFKNLGRTIEIPNSKDGEGEGKEEKREPKQYIFMCNDCPHIWFTDDLPTECPKCHSKNIERFIADVTKNPTGNKRKPNTKKPNGGTSKKQTIIPEPQHLPLGIDKPFVVFDYPSIIFNTDHKLHKLCSKLAPKVSEEIFKAFMSLILNLWAERKLRDDDNQTATLSIQLDQLAVDYLL